MNYKVSIFVNKFQVFIVSLIFWFAGVVMIWWVLILGRLWNWVSGHE